jgi:hypothetical protein
MANGFEDWSGWGITPQPGMAGDLPARPEAMGSLDDYYRPEDDWARFYSQLQPFWSIRAPMQDIGQNLRARYLLAKTGMPGSQTFGQFLSDAPSMYGETPEYLPYQAASLQELRQRAATAAEAATVPSQMFTARTRAGETVTPESPEFYRRAWLAQQFGDEAGNELQAQNQMRIANLLALQGGGTRNYRGGMANAIRSAMANLYQHRLNVGAGRETFLDWYLQQTDPNYQASVPYGQA